MSSSFSDQVPSTRWDDVMRDTGGNRQLTIGIRMLKDDRAKEKPERSLFAAQDMSNKLDRMPLFQLNPKESR